MLRTEITLVSGICACLFSGTLALGQTTISPKEFADTAAQADQYEIQAGRLIAVQSEDTRVRTFGMKMIEDHMNTSNTLREAAIAGGLAPPPKSLNGEQQRMLGALQSMKGSELDRTYIVQQILVHTAALVTERGYATSGSDPGLRKVARTAVPLIQRHLEMAEELKAAVGKN
jgi:putative membrane protein